MELDNESRVYIFAEKAYYALLALCLITLGLFGYMSWFFFRATADSYAQSFTIVIALPMLIALILLFLLLLTGKRAAAKEIAQFLDKS